MGDCRSEAGEQLSLRWVILSVNNEEAILPLWQTRVRRQATEWKPIFGIVAMVEIFQDFQFPKAVMKSLSGAHEETSKEVRTEFLENLKNYDT